jgi:putative SOS response-associated peptidase YedK
MRALICGRFTQHLSWDELHRLADLIGPPRNLRPRYNVAPTTKIEVIRRAAECMFRSERQSLDLLNIDGKER